MILYFTWFSMMKSEFAHELPIVKDFFRLLLYAADPRL